MQTVYSNPLLLFRYLNLSINQCVGDAGVEVEINQCYFMKINVLLLPRGYFCLSLISNGEINDFVAC